MVREKRKQLFLVSNMYPSTENVRYGIFVKRFEQAVENEFYLSKIVLTKKRRLLSKVFGYLKLYSKFTSLIFKVNKDDIVYIHFPLYFSPFLAPLVWREIPVVLNFHGNDAVFDTFLKRFLFIFLKRYARRCCKVVVPSNYYLEKTQKILEIESDKLYVYPSGGIDRSTFYPIVKKSNLFVFGFVSNFIRTKGWAIFLEALSTLKMLPSAIPFKAIMVGDGPDRDSILTYINDKHLDVEIINSVNQSDLAKIYAEFDVLVFPTYREQESLGLVGLEALTCGIPVIATKIAGPRGYIYEGYNGFLFEKENSMDLAEKMIKFQNLSSKDLRIMRKNTLESVKEYDSRKVGKGLVIMLKKLTL